MNLENIKKELKNRKITYQMIADNTNISISTLKDIFRGKTENPRLDTIKLICSYLNIETDNLIYNETNSPILSEEEKEIIQNIRLLDKDKKNRLKGYLKALIENKN